MLVRSSPDGHWILWSVSLQHRNLTSSEDFENSGLGALQQVSITAPSWLPSGGAEPLYCLLMAIPAHSVVFQPLRRFWKVVVCVSQRALTERSRLPELHRGDFI